MERKARSQATKVTHVTATRIRIDLAQGIVEAEGSEEFVRAIYADFKGRLEATAIAAKPPGGSQKGGKDASARPAGDKARRATAYVPKVVKDLDLSGKGGKESLKDFAGKYEAGSNFERNLIYMYYLSQILERSPVTMDDVFTCYRTLQVKAPTDLYSSLFDTARHKGWVEVKSAENVEITVPGINHLEHELKKKPNA